MSAYAYDGDLWIRVMLMVLVFIAGVVGAGFTSHWWARNPLRMTLVAAMIATAIVIVLVKDVGGMPPFPTGWALTLVIFGTFIMVVCLSAVSGGIDVPFVMAPALRPAKVNEFSLEEADYEEYEVAEVDRPGSVLRADDDDPDWLQ
jgi:uncharacterized membrane protein YoaK (UPF0700 family)